MVGDPVNGVDPSGLRKLTLTERNFLESVFGKSLSTAVIDVNPGWNETRAYSPNGNNIRFPIGMFYNEDARYMIRLSDTRIASTLVHEAFHVWQRQHGQWVTTRGIACQVINSLGLSNPYHYDMYTNSQAMLEQFKAANVEAQAQMFEDGIAALVAGDVSVSGYYWDIIQYVKNQ